METWDVVVVGAGTAGVPTAIFAADRGLRVLVVEKLGRIGGTLHMATGQMSAAGTSLQRERGIDDHPDLHFADVMRISKGTSNAEMARLAVDIAAETIEWLRAGEFSFHPDCPAIVYSHETYAIPRTYWGTNKAISILDVLERQFQPRRDSGRITLALDTAATRLLVDGDDAVAGVVVRDARGDETELRARNVVLASGGYAGSKALFRRFNDMPVFGPLPETASGEGIAMAVDAGAGFRLAENFMPSIGGIEDPPGSQRVVWADRPAITPQLRPIWEIFVNRDGRRFVAEDNPSIDARERALLQQPGLTFWIVYDARAAREATPLLPSFTPDRLERAFRDHAAFSRADTIAGLAQAAGIDSAGLAASVAAYNRAVAARGGDEFARAHLPAPIAEPPFCAIRNHGVTVKSAGGLDVDRRLRVRRADGRTFRNLYAAGEAIGGGLLSGNAFVGGMSITPWLGFGRLIGRDYVN
jgi:fumarate reductase flavoprotein subunit